MSARRRQHVLSVAAALGGLALFAWAVRRAGIPETIDGIRRVGWGLIGTETCGRTRVLLSCRAVRCSPYEVMIRLLDSNHLRGTC